MSFTVTITDPGTLSAADKAALAALLGLSVPTIKERVATARAVVGVIAPEDKPDTGAPADAFGHVVHALADPAVIFAEGAVVPSPPRVPSTAAAGAPSTVHRISNVTPVRVPSPPAPPTVSAAGAPSEPAAPPAPVAGGITLDSRGLPWDARIHASTKGVNADGGWKKKKLVTDQQISEVEAELRGLMAKPVAVVVPGRSFPDFLTHMTGLMSAGKLEEQEVRELAAEHGLPSIIALQARPDLISPVWDAVDRLVEIA